MFEKIEFDINRLSNDHDLVAFIGNFDSRTAEKCDMLENGLEDVFCCSKNDLTINDLSM